MKHNPVLQRQIAELSPESVALSQLSFDVADRIAEIKKNLAAISVYLQEPILSVVKNTE